MSKLNQHQALCRALELRGETRDANARTTKYAIYTRRYAGLRNADGTMNPAASPGTRWLVGKSGALRIAGRDNIAHSLPASAVVKKQLLSEGRDA